MSALFTSPEEWQAAEAAARDVLAAAYANGELDVTAGGLDDRATVENSLTVLARRVSKAVIRASHSFETVELVQIPKIEKQFAATFDHNTDEDDNDDHSWLY